MINFVLPYLPHGMVHILYVFFSYILSHILTSYKIIKIIFFSFLSQSRWNLTIPISFDLWGWNHGRQQRSIDYLLHAFPHRPHQPRPCLPDRGTLCGTQWFLGCHTTPPPPRPHPVKRGSRDWKYRFRSSRQRKRNGKNHRKQSMKHWFSHRERPSLNLRVRDKMTSLIQRPTASKGTRRSDSGNIFFIQRIAGRKGSRKCVDWTKERPSLLNVIWWKKGWRSMGPRIELSRRLKILNDAIRSRRGSSVFCVHVSLNIRPSDVGVCNTWQREENDWLWIGQESLCRTVQCRLHIY